MTPPPKLRAGAPPKLPAGALPPATTTSRASRLFRCRFDIHSVVDYLRRHWEYVVMVTAALVWVFTFGPLYNYGLLFVALQEEFHSSATLTGWVGSIPIGLTLLLAPPVNLLSDRFGCRPLCIVGVFLTSSGILATSFLSSITPMFFTFSLMIGVGTGITTACAIDLIIQHFPDERNVKAFAFALSGTTGGWLIFTPAMAFIISEYGWRFLLRIIGPLILVVCMPLVMTFIEPSRLSYGRPHHPPDHCEETKKRNHVEYDRIPSSEATVEGGRHLTAKDPYKSCHTDASTQYNQRTFCAQSKCDKYQQLTCTSSGAAEHVHCKEYLQRGHVIDKTVYHVHDHMTTTCHDVTDVNSKFLDTESYTDDEGIGTSSPPSYSTSPSKSSPPSSSSSLSSTSLSKGETEIDYDAPPRKTAMFGKMVAACTYPELWFISLAVLLNGISDCFIYVTMVHYLLSVGFEHNVGTQAVMIIAISNLLGKMSMSLAGNQVPFPRTFLLVIANAVNIVSAISLMIIRSKVPIYCLAVAIGAIGLAITNVVTFVVPMELFGIVRAKATASFVTFSYGLGFVLGSLVGQSIDRTGSYRGALWAFIAMHATSGLLVLSAPCYQRFFAPDRFVIFDLFRAERQKKRESSNSDGWSCEKQKLADLDRERAECVYVYERVSTV